MSDSIPPSTPSQTQAPGIPEDKQTDPNVEQTSPAPVVTEDRSELLQRAKAFLTSPQVQHEDLAAKRRFLVEKGLNDVEIEVLLREVVRLHSIAAA